MKSVFLRGKMQGARGDATFIVFLCCDVPVEVPSAHWDMRWRWPGAAEMELLGVWFMGCCR